MDFWFGMTAPVRVCWGNKMEGCYMWRVYEIKTSGKVIVISGPTAMFVLGFEI